MADALKVSVISPERVLFEGTATSVVAPAHDGEMGILSAHAPLMTILGRGVLRLETSSGEVRFTVAVENIAAPWLARWQRKPQCRRCETCPARRPARTSTYKASASAEAWPDSPMERSLMPTAGWMVTRPP